MLFDLFGLFGIAVLFGLFGLFGIAVQNGLVLVPQTRGLYRRSGRTR